MSRGKTGRERKNSKKEREWAEEYGERKSVCV